MTPARARASLLPLAATVVWTAAVLSCAGSSGPEVSFFAAERQYRFDFFDTPEECEAHQPPDFHINCFQWIDFFPTGRVEMVVTDIINPGEYTIRGSRVALSFGSTPELPSRLELALSADETTLTEVDTGRVWTLWSES
jgi:hypothetical protein